MLKGISIVIITCNRKEELEKTLKSLDNMKIDFPFEIVVIDQNSTDKTNQLFLEKKDYIQYHYSNINLGVAGGRNLGARVAKYSYLVFLDDDAHFVDENALVSLYKQMDESEYDMFAFQIKTLDGEYYNWPYPKKKKEEADLQFECNKYIGCGHAIKKEFFESVQGYSDCLFFWGEETELILKSFACDKKPVLYLGNIRVIHRVLNQGRIYNPDRFKMQVRNRYFMLNNMFPISCIWYKAYYHLGYIVKAFKNKWFSYYKEAVLEEKKMIKTRKYVLSFSQLLRYLNVYR